MKFLEKLFFLYIHASVHVALAACALVGVTSFHFKFSPDFIFYAFVFLSVVSGYNFIKYATVAKLKHKSLKPRLKTIQVFSFLAFLGLCIVFWFMPLRVYTIFLVLIALGLVYIFPIFFSNKNIRSIPVLKIVNVALVWSIITVVFPLAYAKIDMDISVLGYATKRFLFVLLWILPFEIRDLQYDDQGLGTIPQLIGIRYTQGFGLLLVVLLCVLEALLWQPQSSVPTLVIYALLYSLLLISQKMQSYYFSAFWVEALPILWVILLILYQQIMGY